MSDERARRIRITENGPYEVTGSTPLVRTAIVESNVGEPIGWAPDERLPTGAVYRLCRCGESSTKPFCDDTHRSNGFDGREVADRAPRASRMAVIEGDGIEMTDDPSLCAHAGFCTNRRTSVWEMIHETGDPDVRAELVEMLARCPSGRLAHRPTRGEPDTEADVEPSVAVVRDGPLWVRGGVDVIGADGGPYERRNRVTLCRCGHSRNKPFCDGTHAEIGFRDAAGAPAIDSTASLAAGDVPDPV